MSLIADALKAAQQEREQAGESRGQRGSRAQVIIDAGGPGASRLTMPRAGGGGATRGVVLGAAAIAAVAIALIFTFRGGDDPGATVAAPTAEAIEQLSELAGGPQAGVPAGFGTAGDEESPGPDGAPAGGDLREMLAAGAVTETATPSRRRNDAAARTDVAADAASAGDAEDAPTSAVATLPAAGGPSGAGATGDEVAAAGPPPPSIIRTQPAPETRTGGFRIDVDRPRDDEAGRLFAQALNAQRLGQHESALTLYRRSAALSGGDAELFNNMGASYRALGQLEEARDAYRRALALDPRYAAAWSNLGVVLDALGEQVEARAAFREALRLEPGNTGAKINLANQYHAGGLLSEARRLLAEVVEDDPLLPEGHYALARVLEELNERVAAMRHYSLFLQTSGGRFAELERRVRQHLAVLGSGS